MLLKKLIKQVSNEDLWKLIDEKKVIAYTGIDPTGFGIHIGHLLWLHILINLIKLGNKVIILIGGFTGAIGDPTDKTQARAHIDSNTVSENSQGLLSDIKCILRKYEDHVTYVNNKDWLDSMTCREYMNYAYSMSVNRKVKMETFHNRLQNNLPLTMTEFMYSDFQAIDFCYLNKHYGCNLQVGGSDQWGNISFGTHVASAFCNSELYGAVSHLLTDEKNQKFSKSMGSFYIKDFEKTYHGCMNLHDKVAIQICEMFDVKISDNIIQTKKDLARYIMSLMSDDFESKFDYIEKKAAVLFSHQNAKNVLQDYFIKVDSSKLLTVVMKVFEMEEFQARIVISDGSIKIDSQIEKDLNATVPAKCKISYGKKHHAFIIVE